MGREMGSVEPLPLHGRRVASTMQYLRSLTIPMHVIHLFLHMCSIRLALVFIWLAHWFCSGLRLSVSSGEVVLSRATATG
jgi:hypothetical protein